mmetsp:Transcript_16029/g.34790  ORF Transcript_16029/g.34790 Transcript_16029/m.34790 type:complete len:209 (-) Transcript_16029:632-1258(-)
MSCPSNEKIRAKQSNPVENKQLESGSSCRLLTTSLCAFILVRSKRSLAVGSASAVSAHSVGCDGARAEGRLHSLISPASSPVTSVESSVNILDETTGVMFPAASLFIIDKMQLNLRSLTVQMRRAPELSEVMRWTTSAMSAYAMHSTSESCAWILRMTLPSTIFHVSTTPCAVPADTRPILGYALRQRSSSDLDLTTRRDRLPVNRSS